jgi:hypothetical protein
MPRALGPGAKAPKTKEDKEAVGEIDAPDVNKPSLAAEKKAATQAEKEGNA